MGIQYSSETIAEYIIENNSNYEETARYFHISKRTVCRKIKKLKYENNELYNIVKLVHKLNWYRRSKNGGKTTKKQIERKVKEEPVIYRNKRMLHILYEGLGTWEEVARVTKVSLRTIMRYK